MAKKIGVLLFVCACFLPLQASGGDDLAKLGKARVAAAAKAYKEVIRDVANERPFLIKVYHLSVHWLNAELDVAGNNEQRIAAYKGHLKRLKEWQKAWEGNAGQGGGIFTVIESFQMEGEFWLAKERSATK